MIEYSHQGEGIKVVPAGNSSYKILLDRSTSLWSIETEAGPLPVALRDKRYTSHKHALKDIKNYLDGHAERKLIYTKKKRTEEE